MTTYLVTFYTDVAYAEHLIEAASPEQALQKCRQKARDKLWQADFQYYDGVQPINHIEVRSADMTTVAEWQSDELRLSLAAGDLLEALEGTLQRLEVNNYAGEEDAHIATVKTAMAKAEPLDG